MDATPSATCCASAGKESSPDRARSIGIGGEAGIGKSRLARVIIDETRGDSAVWVIELQCSPFHTQSSLYPVADHLRQRIFGDERQLDDASRWSAIETYLRTTSLNVDEALPLFANLLSVPPPAERAPATITPDRARLLTRHFLVSLMIDRARTGPESSSSRTCTGRTRPRSTSSITSSSACATLGSWCC